MLPVSVIISPGSMAGRRGLGLDGEWIDLGGGGTALRTPRLLCLP